jgi:hypothetical protein
MQHNTYNATQHSSAAQRNATQRATNRMQHNTYNATQHSSATQRNATNRMQHNAYSATQHSSAAQHKARAAELRVPIQDNLASAVTQCFNL